jgi:hypothetical protein
MKHQWKFYPSTSAGGNDPTEPVTVCEECGTEANEDNLEDECPPEEL